MKERTRLSSGNMLLLELLFAIIFFSLALSVTLSVFGEAYVLSKQAEGRDMAVAETNDVAEMIRSAQYASEMDDLFARKGLTKDADGHYVGGYGDGRYSMMISSEITGKLYSADIACYDLKNSGQTDAIYTLRVDHAVKEETDGR